MQERRGPISAVPVIEITQYDGALDGAASLAAAGAIPSHNPLQDPDVSMLTTSRSHCASSLGASLATSLRIQYGGLTVVRCFCRATDLCTTSQRFASERHLWTSCGQFGNRMRNGRCGLLESVVSTHICYQATTSSGETSDQEATARILQGLLEEQQERRASGRGIPQSAVRAAQHTVQPTVILEEGVWDNAHRSSRRTSIDMGVTASDGTTAPPSYNRARRPSAASVGRQ